MYEDIYRCVRTHILFSSTISWVVRPQVRKKKKLIPLKQRGSSVVRPQVRKNIKYASVSSAAVR